jgi:hypothetical protein
MSRRSGPRVLTAVAFTTMIVAFIGFMVTLMLNFFVFDDYDAYGEVPIPGSGRLHLPAGDVTVNFHTPVIGGGNGGLPVPQMSIGIIPPDGVPDPVLTEDIGATTTVNNDARVRVWVAHIPADGDYQITTKGRVSAYVDPTLAFGHDSDFGYVPVGFGVLAGVGLVTFIGARVWARRVRRQPTPRTDRPQAYEPWVLTDEGVRVEQLDTLNRLRHSGALTEAEYQAEKKRVLDGR